VGCAAFGGIVACGDSGDDGDEAGTTDAGLTGADGDTAGAEPSTDCASRDYNPLLRSCLRDALNVCDAPSGTCDAVRKRDETIITFKNGVKYDIRYTGLSAIDSVTTRTQKDGATACVIAEAVADVDDCVVKRVYRVGPDRVTLCERPQGGFTVTCADGTTEQYPNLKSSAVKECWPAGPYSTAECTVRDEIDTGGSDTGGSDTGGDTTTTGGSGIDTTGGDTTTTGGSDTGPVEIDCDTRNPYNSTCLGTLAAGCEPPVGACTTRTANGTTEVRYGNGVYFTTRTEDVNGVVNTSESRYTLGGALCWNSTTFKSRNGCETEVTYTDAAGDSYVLCIKRDGSSSVKCPDRSTDRFDAADDEAVRACQPATPDPRDCR